jgi:hypothetical protein
MSLCCTAMYLLLYVHFWSFLSTGKVLMLKTRCGLGVLCYARSDRFSCHYSYEEGMQSFTMNNFLNFAWSYKNLIYVLIKVKCLIDFFCPKYHKSSAIAVRTLNLKKNSSVPVILLSK